MSGRARSLRPVGVAGIAWGALLLAGGPRLFEALETRASSEGERAAMVVLGVRHALQGAVQVLAPHHLGRLYATVDGLHAASMVGVAALAPERRRAALVSAGVATASGLLSLRQRG